MPRVDINTLRQELREVQDSHPAWTLDNAFVHWFLRAFLVADDELAARAVTGVSNDKGVDAVLVDDETNRIFVLQGKCHLGANPPNEKRNDVLGFARLASVIRGAAEYAEYRKGIDPLVGQRLDRAIKLISRKNYTLHLYYVSTGRCSSPLKDEAESLVNRANGHADLSVFDRKEVLTLLTDYIGGAAPPVPSLDLHVDSSGIIGSDGMIQRYDQKTGIESWILTMTGKDAGSLHKLRRRQTICPQYTRILR